MTIYSQRTPGYQNITLGFGSGSIWEYGCVITSFCQGLSRFGIKYTPPEMNTILKDRGLFTGSTKNLMNNTRIFELPFIDSFLRIDKFTMELLEELLKTHVVNAEVSPAPIGGTGQHFVAVDGVEGANAIIIDPFFGDRIKVAERYGKHGNILSLRVYKINSSYISNNNGEPMSDVPKVLQKYGKGSLSDLIAYFDQELIFLDQARKELVDKDRLVQGLMLSLQDQEKKTKELGEKIKGMVTKEWKEQAVAKVKIECQQMIDQKIADWTNEKTDLVKKITVYEEKYGVLQSDEDGNTIIVEPTVEPIPFFLLRFLDWLKGKIL